jgi:hypothetical protein
MNDKPRRSIACVLACALLIVACGDDGGPVETAARLDPDALLLEGPVVALTRYDDGQPKQVGISIAPVDDSFWLVDDRELVYLGNNALARDLAGDVGRSVRVQGDVFVGLDFLRTVFPNAYELDGVVVTAPGPSPQTAKSSLEGTIVVLERYANGHPHVLGIATDDGDVVSFVETNKSEELRYRIGRQVRVDGVRHRRTGSMTVVSYTELEGNPLVRAGDGFRLSFLAGGLDENGQLMGGVEVDTLAAFDGKVFAGTSYRRNTQEETPDPMVPGQVLVLDRPDGRWRVEFTIPTEEATNGPRVVLLTVVRFETDGSGRPLDHVVTMLAAVGGNGEIYLRAPGEDEPWIATGLRETLSQVAPGRGLDARSLVSHTDAITGVSSLFVGAGVGRHGGDGGGIYRGTYDPTRPTRITWSPVPEVAITGQDANPRVMGLTVAEGQVYASLGKSLLRRTDGPTPTWNEVYTYSLPAGLDALRRASVLHGPGGEPSLLFGVEGVTGRMVRVDLETGEAIPELLPLPAVAGSYYAILAYNGPAIRFREGGEIAIAGMELFRPRSGPVQPEIPDLGRHYDWTDGLIVVRDPDGTYGVNRIHDPTLEVHPPVVGVRAILPHSPFPGEEDVMYFGGFDHLGHYSHNTGWIFKAHVDDVLDTFLTLP